MSSTHPNGHYAAYSFDGEYDWPHYAESHGSTAESTQHLTLDYGSTYSFKSVTLVLMNSETYGGTGAALVEMMVGVTISLLDGSGEEVSYNETFDKS